MLLQVNGADASPDSQYAYQTILGKLIQCLRICVCVCVCGGGGAKLPENILVAYQYTKSDFFIGGYTKSAHLN